MKQNIFLLGYFKIIYYLYQLKNTLNVLVPLPGLTRGNLMECQENIENMAFRPETLLKSGSDTGVFL